MQLNRKYNFLSNAKAVLDLCAAPGGWLQVAAKAIPMSSLILGVDLVPIKPVKGVKTFLGDITTQQCRQQIKREAKGSMMDVVLHDGAPNIGGAWASEAYTQVRTRTWQIVFNEVSKTPHGSVLGAWPTQLLCT